MDNSKDNNKIEENNELQKNSFMNQYTKLIQETIVTPTEDYNEKIKPITELIKSNMPKSLYRFRTCNENSLDAYLNNHIYHSKPISFNDPHDCLVFIDKKALVNKTQAKLTIEHLQTIVKDWHNWEQMPDSFFFPYTRNSPEMQEIANRYKNITTEQLQSILGKSCKELEKIETVMYNHFRTYPKIACFSENILSTLMWAHYADYHKGFALEYDFTQGQSQCIECQKQCNNFAFMNLYPVIYGNERCNVTELTYFMLHNEIFKSLGLPVNPNSIPDKLIYTKVNLYKGIDWKYEKEWRSILTCTNNPYNHKVTVKPKAIYLGANIAPVYQNILSNYAISKSIDIYKMTVDINVKEHKLDFHKL